MHRDALKITFEIFNTPWELHFWQKASCLESPETHSDLKKILMCEIAFLPLRLPCW